MAVPIRHTEAGRVLQLVEDGAVKRRRRVSKRTLVGVAIFLGVLVYFLTQTRLPATLEKFVTIDRPQTQRGRNTFGQVLDPSTFPAPLRWIAYGVNLWDANAIGMFFAVLLSGAAVGAFTPGARIRALVRKRGPLGAGVGGVMGLPLFMCSACSAPVSMGFYRNGAAMETSLGMILGSALFNPVGIVAVFTVFPTAMALARVSFGLVAIFALAPLVVYIARKRRLVDAEACSTASGADVALPSEPATWRGAVIQGFSDWVRNTTDIALRLVPPMLVATLLVGVVFTIFPPQQISDRVHPGLVAIIAAAALGSLLQLPTMFEIPLVLGALALGLGIGPATALLVTAPSAGVVTWGITRSDLGWKVPSLLLAGNFVLGIVAGLVVSWI